MNKKWDYEIPTIEIFKEMLRVAKPGAFLLCFGGSRTFYRMAVNIEDAGWEIRDTIMWLYGSGFPKSYNISKGIDKHFGAEREVVGKKPNVHSMGKMKMHEGYKRPWMEKENSAEKAMELTAPATLEAQQWNGYGTALKPAFEPIIVAMKPVDKNFVNNALTHGVAGLNIDGCRIETDELKNKKYNNSGKNLSWGGTYGKGEVQGNSIGRWPANIILSCSCDFKNGEHDNDCPVKMLDEQSGNVGGDTRKSKETFDKSIWASGKSVKSKALYNDTGGASRFFYCAKASKSERNAGCEVSNEYELIENVTDEIRKEIEDFLNE